MATLQFGTATSNDGFTSFSTAAFNDLPPARIVRELIQNSLDAAVDAGEATAKVRFQVDRIRRGEVPDLKGYTSAFKKAVAHQTKTNNGELPDAAQEVANRIQSGLDSIKAGTAALLSVVDNGIGLDVKSMNSLLADGSSGKSTSASGSYGVGHLAPMALSDIRYMLYGGLTSYGERIVCGKTVLASHPGKGKLNDAKGYLVNGFRSGLEADGNLYDFLDANAHPKLIAKHLDLLSEEHGHGCVMMIPAFNNFRSSGAAALGNSVQSGRLQLRSRYPSRQACHRGSGKRKHPASGCSLIGEHPRTGTEPGSGGKIGFVLRGPPTFGAKRLLNTEIPHGQQKPKRDRERRQRTGQLADASAERLRPDRPVPQRHVDHGQHSRSVAG